MTHKAGRLETERFEDRVRERREKERLGENEGREEQEETRR